MIDCAVFSATQLTGKLVLMKTTIDLPDDLVREVKLRALMERRTLRDLVADFIRQGLGMSSPGTPDGAPSGSHVPVGVNGLPVIRCPIDAPAARMRPEDLVELEQQAQAAEDRRFARRPV